MKTRTPRKKEIEPMTEDGVWEDVDITGKVMQIQCGKCWKMVKTFFIRRRRTPMGTLIHEVECKRCHTVTPNAGKQG